MSKKLKVDLLSTTFGDNTLYRSVSGKEGFLAIINGTFTGIKNIETVYALKDSGMPVRTLGDGDFNNILNIIKQSLKEK